MFFFLSLLILTIFMGYFFSKINYCYLCSVVKFTQTSKEYTRILIRAQTHTTTVIKHNGQGILQ